ncbi:MAG: hypothetical protein KKB95_10150 [Gammaproteobacteria bacterium]|nr:hypothetical protein [Gammaproteobacteria bacterium]MBU1505920.1 hypothetical protein [Gammaproteobacteria bacterium]MBU2123550.1 hypothetical protein [Gammaproteobacteria bacterium]MBU2172486.1 hypothetical protein [Gammaproteobacteria bacterium]MBU2201944.1 hypothetical protein [Gammaproteobacteria bacterium]
MGAINAWGAVGGLGVFVVANAVNAVCAAPKTGRGIRHVLVSCAIGLGRRNLGFVLIVFDAFAHPTCSDTIRRIHQIPATGMMVFD